MLLRYCVLCKVLLNLYLRELYVAVGTIKPNPLSRVVQSLVYQLIPVILGYFQPIKAGHSCGA